MNDLNLKAYLDRIHWTGPLNQDLGTLAALQLGHVSVIPFENLDVQLGYAIRLDLASLQNKMVDRRRGGYCFEKNSLLAAVLQNLGFRVTLREGRVRRGVTRLLPRTHLALQVDLAEGSFLVDGGFGADGPLGPVPLAGSAVTYFNETSRVLQDGPLQVLQVLRGTDWLDLYALEPGTPQSIDLEMANYYTSTHPDSRFVQVLTAQCARPEARWNLRNFELTVRDIDGERTEIISPSNLLPLLRTRFGLEIPEGTRFRFQEA